MTIGQTIRAFRKKRGLTQAQLGELCGLSGGAIGSYEKGVTLPKRRVVEKLARALDIPVEKLAEEEPAPGARPEASASDALLYDGILAALKEIYGMVEGKIVLGENGAYKKYYVIKQIPDSFVLYEKDIAAIARSAKASMFPLMEHLKTARQVGMAAERGG